MRHVFTSTTSPSSPEHAANIKPHPTPAASPLVPKSPGLSCPSPRSPHSSQSCSSRGLTLTLSRLSGFGFPLVVPGSERRMARATDVPCLKRSTYFGQIKPDFLPPNHKVHEASEGQSNATKAQAHLFPLTGTFHTPLARSHCPCRSHDDRLLSQRFINAITLSNFSGFLQHKRKIKFMREMAPTKFNIGGAQMRHRGNKS